MSEQETELSSPQAELQLDPVIPRLSDGVVGLRGIELADAEKIAEICQQAAAQRWLPALPSPYSLEDAQYFVQEVAAPGWQKGERHSFAVVREDENVFLGSIDLHLFRGSTAEIGINIGDQSQGSGVALRAVQLIVDYAFNGLDLRHLYWRAEVPNWASHKLAWKAGFRFEAELRAFADNRGESIDQWLLSLASDEPREPQAAWAGPEKPVG
ncbi:GNAT family N-acetyltransferase [Psychromicrobium lacuslunae]|uniref:GNAT family N-acetyltransferase n=1 Tax=Psychromicrobium lacuslunae TaxID=1618207 RepID=UPI0005D2F8D8|nr:GNAT family protein [Psychromicrobium lacuslunae]